MDKPNLKYDHIFTVIRIDDYGDLETALETRIVATKSFLSKEKAEKEVKRLNALNKDKGAHYLYQLNRLDIETQ